MSQRQYVGYWSLNHTDCEGPQIQMWKYQKPNIIHRFFNMYCLGTVWFDDTPKEIVYGEGPKFEPICYDNPSPCSQEPDGYIVEGEGEDDEPQPLFKN